MVSPIQRTQACEHVWGEEYHTHLGHETLGAHTTHKDCIKCGVIYSENLGLGDIYLCSSEFKKYWTILPKSHHCFAGWRGRIIYDREFGR